MEAKGGTKAIGKKAGGDKKGQDGDGRRKKRKVRDDRKAEAVMDIKGENG